MPAKWQQWMPFHIDRFKGSPAVQAMHPAARMGYLYLLSCQWQSDECSISGDAMDLADMSGLGDELWAIHGPRILRNFEALADGMIRNQVCSEEWAEAKRIFDARKASAIRTNTVRSPHGHRVEDERSPSRSADTITGTGTLTGTETGVTGASAMPSETPDASFADDEEQNIPDDLPAAMMGNFLLQRLSIPHSHGLAMKFADCVGLIARDERLPRGAAALQLLVRGRDHPPDSGKWRFWLEDGSWKEQVAQGISTEGWE